MTGLRKYFLVLITVLMVAALGAQADVLVVDAEPPEDLPTIALNTIAQENNIPLASLEVVNSVESSLPGQDIPFFGFKVMDVETGELYVLYLDENGDQVDIDQIVSKAQEAQVERIDPKLAAQLTNTPANESVPVIIWLYEPDYEATARPEQGEEYNEEKQEAAHQSRAAFVEAIEAPVANRLSGMGYEVGTDETISFLYAALPPGTISEVASWSEVRMVWLDDTLSNLDDDFVEPTLESAYASTAYYPYFWYRRLTGRGIKVGVLEVGGRGQTANPYLRYYTQDTTYVCSTPTSHSTGVLGLIYSSHRTRMGFAIGSEPWLGGTCSGSSSQMLNRTGAAVSWGANVLNHSYGADTNRVLGPMDVYMDNLVHNVGRSTFVAAGNDAVACGTGAGGDVLSPGLAYNVVTVANFDDRNTGAWSDDIMRFNSSWRDPVSFWGDRDKPEVAAPGTNMNSTTTASPWTGGIGSGTSYAAPVVAGVAADMMQYNWNLPAWPEATKAILMTGAPHNIEGASRFSECDGAGAIHVKTIDDIMRGWGGGFGQYGYNCSAPTYLTLATRFFVAGRQSRVTIVWNTPTSYSGYPGQPSADLDLRIIHPNGSTVVTGSYSFDNTFEIVSFNPPVTGNYKIQVWKRRCNVNPQYLGWAYWYSPN